MTQPPADSTFLICPACGYDLRGIASERCPECGTIVDRAATAVSRIPWTHRKNIGIVRAYWRTLILATFRIGRLGEEVNRPVIFGDANRFRWMTVAIASFFPIAIFITAVSINGGTGFLDLLAGFNSPRSIRTVPPQADVVLPFAAGLTRWPVLPLATIIWFALVSGVAMYWFHPRDKPARQRDRASALSLYACAPLAWLAIAFALWAGGAMSMSDESPGDFLHEVIVRLAPIAAAGGVILALIAVFLYWINLIRLMKITLQAGSVRIISFAIGFPLACVVCAVVAFGLFPWIAGYIWLLVDSLR